MSLAFFTDERQLCLTVRVDRGEVVVKEFLRIGISRRVVERRCQCLVVTQVVDFQRRELPIKNTKFIDKAVGEAPIPESLPDGEIVSAAASDVFVKVIPDNVALGHVAVEINSQPVRSAGAIPRDDDMVPLLRRQLLLCANSNRIAWPEVDQGGAESSLFDQQLITATAGVGPGS